MKIIATSIVLLASSWLLQPIVANKWEEANAAELYRQCWSKTSQESLMTLVNAQVLRQLEVVLRREVPDAKLSAAEIDKSLRLTVGVPVVESVSLQTKGADCNAQVDIEYHGATASGIVGFSLRQSANGASVLVSGAQISPLLNRFGASISALTAK